MGNQRRLSSGIRTAFSGALIALCLATSSLASDDSIHFERILKEIEETPSGKLLLKHARSWWGFHTYEDFLSVLVWGEISRTDAVLTRHFDPVSGEEKRERVVRIHIRKDQTFEEMVLDLSHEIVHATTLPAWDPYDPLLTASQYIWASLEAPGGEIDALVLECRVAVERRKLEPAKEYDRCLRYVENEQVSRRLVQKDFYKVGSWYDALVGHLKGGLKRFPYLSGEEPALISSTGKAPYPVALFVEYDEMNKIACSNTKRRVQQTRTPAQASATFLTKRCY